MRNCILTIALGGLSLLSGCGGSGETQAVHDEAVTELQKLNARLTFDEKAPGKPVIKVDLERLEVGDKELEKVKGLSNVEFLNLRVTNVTSAGLAHLKGLSKLEILYLNHTDIADAGLAHLKGLSGLKELDLTATNITDAGLVHLKGLTKLRSVTLTGTKVTQNGIDDLQKSLSGTTIHYSPVGD